MRFTILMAGAFFLAICGCARTHPPDPAHDVDIVAPDGHVLKASYFSPGKPGPAILLIHQCNMDRHAWDTLTADLTAAGVHVLTFDQRGFGDTRGAADGARITGDADAAYAYLLSKKEVERGQVAAGGASCGVTYSSALAARHPEIKALVLLSGWVDDRSRAYFAATPSLALFGAASGYRSDAADIRQAVAASKHPQSTSRILPGSAHGVAMFDANPDLRATIVKWLQVQLVPGSEEHGR